MIIVSAESFGVNIGIGHVARRGEIYGKVIG